MGVKLWLLLVLALGYGPGLGSAGDGGLVRSRRQSQWWQTHPGQASPRWGSREVVQPVVGFGSGSRWGSLDSHPMGVSRQLPSLASSPIRVQCGEDIMVVTVERDFFGNGKLVKISDLALGPGPQPCKPDPGNSNVATFRNPLQSCGNTVQMIQDWVIYSTVLKYWPTTAANIPISRTNPATVPIQCFYPRHGNVSSKAIKPTWAPFSTTVSSEQKLSFFLQLMTSDWTAPSPPVFKLGDIMYIQAYVDIQNHAPMILFVDGCVATTTSDPNSTPRYEIIADNGCLLDGMQEDASSAFISPRVQPNQLQFTVDAFRFLNVDVSMIFITCYLSAVPITQVPDPLHKACSYSKSSSSWTAVEGASSICQCCATGTCSAPSGHSRRWGAPMRNVGRVKREANTESHIEEQHMVTTLGPLMVVWPDSVLALKEDEKSDTVEFWVLASVGGVSLLFVLICAILIGKALGKPKQLVLTVEK